MLHLLIVCVLTDSGVGMVTVLPRLLVERSSVFVGVFLLRDEPSVLPSLAAGL